MYNSANVDNFPKLNLPSEWNGALGWAGVAACINNTGLHAEDFIPKKEHRDMCARCPVLVACLKNSKDSLEVLIKNRASLDVKSKDGVTPLIFAAANNGVEVMKYLLEVNPKLDLDASADSTYNALLFAALNGAKEAVEFLISKGADIEYETKSGKTALMLATSKNKKEIVEILKKNGAKK